MITMVPAQLFDWVISVINFAIMFSLFRLVVIIPMEQAVKLRRQRVALRLKEIDQIAAEALARQEEFEAKFSDVETVLVDIKTASERNLAQAKVKIAEKADAEARYLLEKASVESKSLRRDAEAEVRSRIAAQAVSRAEAILNEALDAGAQNAIVAAGVKKVGELSAT